MPQEIGLLHGNFDNRLGAESAFPASQKNGLLQVVKSLGSGHGVAAFNAADQGVVEHETQTKGSCCTRFLVLVALVDFLQQFVISHIGRGRDAGAHRTGAGIAVVDAVDGIDDGFAVVSELGLLVFGKSCGESLLVVQNPDDGRQRPGLLKFESGKSPLAFGVRAGTGAAIDGLPELRCDFAGIGRGDTGTRVIGGCLLHGFLISSDLLFPGT